MAVSIGSAELSPAQTSVAGFFAVLGLLYFVSQLTRFIRVVLSTFVFRGTSVSTTHAHLVMGSLGIVLHGKE